jgi:hypothetical protein
MQGLADRIVHRKFTLTMSLTQKNSEFEHSYCIILLY